MSLFRWLFPPRISWACHYCVTWEGESYTDKGGRKKLARHEWDAHRSGPLVRTGG